MITHRLISLSKLLVMLFTSLVLIYGCGFKARGVGYENIAGQQVQLLSENPYGPLERNIKNKLNHYSIITNTRFVDGTNFELENDGIKIINIKLNKEPISVDANGRPAEYEMIISVDAFFYFRKFTLSDKKGTRQQFSERRDYRYTSNNNLAHDRELQTLTAEMYDDLSRRIIEQFLRQLSSQISAESLKN